MHSLIKIIDDNDIKVICENLFSFLDTKRSIIVILQV